MLGGTEKANKVKVRRRLTVDFGRSVGGEGAGMEVGDEEGGRETYTN